MSFTGVPRVSRQWHRQQRGILPCASSDLEKIRRANDRLGMDSRVEASVMRPHTQAPGEVKGCKPEQVPAKVFECQAPDSTHRDKHTTTRHRKYVSRRTPTRESPPGNRTPPHPTVPKMRGGLQQDATRRTGRQTPGGLHTWRQGTGRAAQKDQGGADARSQANDV